MVENYHRSWKSILFVIVQFFSLGLIGLTGPVLPGSFVLLLIELIGLGLGVWAVLVMGIGNFNIIPDPFQWTKLVQGGPYQWIRHPVFAADNTSPGHQLFQRFSVIGMDYAAGQFDPEIEL